MQFHRRTCEQARRNDAEHLSYVPGRNCAAIHPWQRELLIKETHDGWHLQMAASKLGLRCGSSRLPLSFLLEV